MNQSFVLGVIMLLLFVERSVAQSYDEIEKLIERRKLADAEKALNEKLAVNSIDDSAHYFLGNLCLFQKNKYDDAVKHFEKCVELKPQTSLYHTQLGQALGRSAQQGGIFAQIGSVGRVKGSFEKAVQLDPDDFEARYMLVLFHLNAPGIVGGSWDVAKQQAREYEKYSSRGSALLWMLIHAQLKEHDKFLSALENAKIVTQIEQDAMQSAVSMEFSNLMQENLWDKAKRISAKFVEISPSKFWGYLYSGRCLLEEKKYDEAIAQLAKSIELEKSYTPAYYYVGVANDRKGDKEKAIEYYQKYVEMEKRGDTVEKVKKRIEELKK
ncbi:MAG: hypothetical protein HY22_00705 [[Candidatus Thermochlorobacteriaceae] bacterium GBChlB]|nr:MAG: hypothetical protein HY22_00705 [[Candidatus Thermochlorobacteriaceae] bacterium GBChlB]